MLGRCRSLPSPQSPTNASAAGPGRAMCLHNVTSTVGAMPKGTLSGQWLRPIQPDSTLPPLHRDSASSRSELVGDAAAWREKEQAAC
jgi:hypothetical protein